MLWIAPFSAAAVAGLGSAAGWQPAAGDDLEPKGAPGPAMAVLVALLALAALYHLQLYLRRRESRESLWFALAIFDFLLIVCADPWLAGLSAGAAGRILEGALHLALPLALQFCWSFLGRPIGRTLRAYQLSQVLLAVLVVAVPGSAWIAASGPWRWAWGLPGWLLLAMTLAGELWRGDLETRIVGSGGVAISLGGVIESGARTVGWGSTLPLPVWAAAAFAGAVTAALAVRFQRAHLELDELRQQLEEMVEDRSRELEAANRKLHGELAEKSLAEEALRMLERGVEQSIDGIVVTDVDGRIQFANRSWARMHGYEVAELIGAELRIFHSPEQQREELGPCLEKVWAEGACEGEIGHVRKDGTPFPTWMSVTRLHDPERGPVGLVAVGRDLAERKQSEREQATLENKLRRARRLESLGDLAGGIANDYNNALTGVLANAALLARGRDPSSPVTEKIHHIEAAAERARELTDQLLAYAGENPTVARKLAVSGLVAELAEELRPRFAERAVLSLRLADDLPLVEADPEQLRRALRNLVDNALEALGDGPGEVSLVTRSVDADREYLQSAELAAGRPAGRYVAIEVTDDGCGIREEVRAKIFDPFYSSRPTARGLGLATVFGIVRAHRGAIKVRSRPGEGATFELLLPALAEAEAVKEASPDVDLPPRFAGTGTVLVIDDEELMREVSESILVESGFQVLTASDGPEALELVRRDRDSIRLVLLDNKMPVMGGREVLSAIRRLDPEMRVILMSGFREHEVLRGFTGAGLAGFLQKPFRPEDLLGKVRQVLAAG